MTPSYQILTLIARTPDKMISSLMIPDPVFNTIIYTCQLCTDSICNKTINKPEVKLSYLELQRVLYGQNQEDLSS